MSGLKEITNRPANRLKTQKTTETRPEPANLLIKRPRLRPLHGQPTGCRRTWFEEPCGGGGSPPPSLLL